MKVPKENLLPGKSGLGAPLMCLDSARFGIAWERSALRWTVMSLPESTLRSVSIRKAYRKLSAGAEETFRNAYRNHQSPTPSLESRQDDE